MAAGDANLEFAWKIIEIGVTHEGFCSFTDERGGIANFVGIYAGDWAAGDVARNVAAGTHGEQANFRQCLYDFGKCFN